MKTEETYEDPTCEVWRISLIVIGLLTFFTNGRAQQKQSWIEGAFYTEANYGYNFFGEDRHTIDFPHVILDLTLHLGKGWHFSTEQDVEYLQECGLKPQSFRDMHSCNWAYLQKDFVPEAQLLIGILKVPVGLTSSFRGTGLTVYDPLAEGCVLPMKWHETGVALTGQHGKWDYWLGYLAHLGGNLHSSHSLGVAARIDYQPVDGISLGVSGFHGKGAEHSKLTSDGMVEHGQRATYLSADIVCDRGRWIASAQYVYLSVHDDIALGAEVGYRLTDKITPFVRYDWLSTPHNADYKVATAGVNAELLKNLVVKAQVAQERSMTRIDTSVSYYIEF